MEGFSEVYMMRDRMYHSKYGRFMNLDPNGFTKKSTNLYSFMGNNPIEGEIYQVASEIFFFKLYWPGRVVFVVKKVYIYIYISTFFIHF